MERERERGRERERERERERGVKRYRSRHYANVHIDERLSRG